MSAALQNVIVFIAITGACAFVGWQGYKTLSLRKGKLGACCSKGCDAEPTKSAEPKTQFVPVEFLTGRK